jgi:hypothetical protein
MHFLFLELVAAGLEARMDRTESGGILNYIMLTFCYTGRDDVVQRRMTEALVVS